MTADRDELKLNRELRLNLNSLPRSHLPICTIPMAYTSTTKPSSTVLIATLPSRDSQERVIVQLVQDQSSGTTATLVEICQQSYGDGIGWYNQQSVALEPAQLAALRNVLGAAGRPSGVVASDGLRDASQAGDLGRFSDGDATHTAAEFPRILRANSA